MDSTYEIQEVYRVNILLKMWEIDNLLKVAICMALESNRMYTHTILQKYVKFTSGSLYLCSIIK